MMSAAHVTTLRASTWHNWQCMSEYRRHRPRLQIRCQVPHWVTRWSGPRLIAQLEHCISYGQTLSNNGGSPHAKGHRLELRNPIRRTRRRGRWARTPLLLTVEERYVWSGEKTLHLVNLKVTTRNSYNEWPSETCGSSTSGARCSTTGCGARCGPILQVWMCFWEAA